MAIPTFPVLTTIGFPKRTVAWSTIKQPSIGGQESRFANWSFPRWSYDFPIELLRQSSTFTPVFFSKASVIGPASLVFSEV